LFFSILSLFRLSLPKEQQEESVKMVEVAKHQKTLESTNNESNPNLRIRKFATD